MSRYNILVESSHTELVIKKSQFITDVFHCETPSQLKGFYKKLERVHPKARHYCWAMICNAPNDSSGYGFSDDGEPSGTAGKPLLNVLSHANVGKCALITTRYFGGVKLGTGGLVKAYTNAAKLGIETAVWKPYVQKVVVHVVLNFSDESTIRHYCDIYDATVLDTSYSSNVTMRMEIAKELLPLFKSSVQENLHHISFS